METLEQLPERPMIRRRTLLNDHQLTEREQKSLALLELIRLRQIRVLQPEAFGEIEICFVASVEAAPSTGQNGEQSEAAE